MKIKRILSTALVLVLLFTAVSVVIPATEAEAAYSPSTSVSEATMTLDEIKTYISDVYLKYNFDTAEDMLAYELAAGYLDHSTSVDGIYTIYVNRYTGFLYYRNNFSGQILTSNPVNPAYTNITGTLAEEIMSQISIKMYETSVSSNQFNYNSVHWASMYGQISVTEIAGGLRVNYTLGDTSTRYLLPGIITAEDFTSDIILPMLEALGDKFEEVAPNSAFDFVGSRYDDIENKGYIEFTKLQGYITEVQTYTSNKQLYDNYIKPIMLLSNAYSLKDPAMYADDPETLATINKQYPITASGTAVYVFDMTVDNSIKKQYSNYIKTLCPEYDIIDMYDDEEECGYVHNEEQKLVLRCALEYTFNEDGSLSARLPANSVSFDETVYTLENITPLQYFGCGDMSEDGFFFFPDGSGTVISFDDFYSEATGKKINLSLYADVFGHDYCYSTITGAHRQQITMPVYGLVTQFNTNKTTADMLAAAGSTSGAKTETGYFAILEEGATLAQLNFSSGGSSHKFVNVFASYSPYPSDEYDLSKTLSVGSLGTYTIVSESKYTGSYITRYTMLVDDNVGTALYGAGNYYNTTYAGMASYYRNYLKADGTLGALEVISEGNIPLYIETFGTMSILKKVLTFPVETTIPLTTFEDVVTMYNELANATEHVQSLIDECYANVEAAEEESDKELYRRQAAEYEDLLTKISDIKNVNFRLTGFANGGMYYTYPTKVKWERKCGGKDGFKDLVATTNSVSAEEGINFSVYPEFDFMYITNTSAFDGIRKGNTASRMVDNRYASKQTYNAVLQKYENFFTLVISSDALDSLYSDFYDDYSEYDTKNLSASTLGSDINSNFDKDNPINRDQARADVIALLDRIANTDGYSLMLDAGNIYTVKYAEHILNVATDSSHFQFSSYAVPFVGMILHGHVNYAGSPMNYSGSIDYEILRSIENGAAPYFILCYQNTSYMKEDEQLNKYYGVNYDAWYADMLKTYHELNTQIGSLQDYEITDHKTVIVERNREESEKRSDYNALEKEYLELLEADIVAKINATFAQLKEEGKYDERVRVVVDIDAIVNQFKTEAVGTQFSEEDAQVVFNQDAFTAKLTALLEAYTTQYPGSETEALNVDVNIGAMSEYASKYCFYTLSDCLEDDDVYTVTEYTLDNGKVAIVTYQKGDSVVRFILNYNIYTVNVRIDGQVYTLGKYEYKKI